VVERQLRWRRGRYSRLGPARPGQPPDTQNSQATVGVDRADRLPGRKHNLERKLDQVGVVGVHRPVHLRAGVDGSDQRR
jgi:hypothetical protein